MNNPDDLIKKLKLTPHPEGGHFAESFRDNKGGVSLIYYLLKKGQTSHWHKLTKNEILHFYDGDPLRIYMSKDKKKILTIKILNLHLKIGKFNKVAIPATCPVMRLMALIPPICFKVMNPKLANNNI